MTPTGGTSRRATLAHEVLQYRSRPFPSLEPLIKRPEVRWVRLGAGRAFKVEAWADRGSRRGKSGLELHVRVRRSRGMSAWLPAHADVWVADPATG